MKRKVAPPISFDEIRFAARVLQGYQRQLIDEYGADSSTERIRRAVRGLFALSHDVYPGRKAKP